MCTDACIQIEHGCKTPTSTLHDYCDGEGFTTHPLFSVHNERYSYISMSLRCVPLGSKVKIHKLGNACFIHS